MELLKYLGFSVNTLFTITSAIVLLILVYFFTISVFGWKKRKENCKNIIPTNKYAIIIAAHNEETVIRNTIYSVKAMNYPEENFEVYVVADNCTDNTAQIARDCGAVVYERFDAVKKGKGQALNWMLDILFASENTYDAVCILDADNLVSKDFLLQIDRKMQQGYKVVQGYRDMKNPWDSWITSSYSITYWLANRLCQLPRQYLGMNCTLTGSGYAVSTDILREIGWEIETLTEDVEFYFQLCLNDIKIGWAHEAVIFDEQPITLSQSWKQRTRWMQGHFSCCFIYGKQVFSKLLEEKSLQSFDTLIMLLYPFLYVVGSLLLGLQGMKTVLAQIDDVNLRTIIIFTAVSLCSFLLQNIYSFSVLVNEKKANRNIIMGLIVLPIFNFTWIPIMVQGYLSRKNKDWAHIAHTSTAV